MIRITAKGLAKFMTAGESRKRTILRDFKHPDPEGFAQANYYHEARGAIRRYIEGEIEHSQLLADSAALRNEARASAGPTAARLKNNARAIAQFARKFSDFRCEVLGKAVLSMTHADVRVSASPDLHVRLRGKESLVRFEFSNQKQADLVPKVMCQAMADACASQALEVAPKDCLYIDVPGGEIHRKARSHARVSADIAAACQNLAAIWPTV
jgi:hypothetical protein